MGFDILSRIDAWKKAEREPERTSAFLRDSGPTVNDTDKRAPSFGGNVSDGKAKLAALSGIADEAEAAKTYLEQAQKVDEAGTKEILEDVAKEEMVHMGEFSTTLQKVAPELAEKVPEGMSEAEKKIESK